MKDEQERQDHESFGMLGFSRVCCGPKGMNLFGSAIRHTRVISLTLRRAHQVRHLNEDRYYAHEELFRVEMSPTQFAELISTLNMGDGIPCTITRVGKEMMADCPETTMRRKFEAEFEQMAHDITKSITDLIRQAQEIMEKKNINKGDRKEIMDKLAAISQDIHANMPFVCEQFNESMDKIVGDAKGAIEAFFLHRATDMRISPAELRSEDLPIALALQGPE